MYLAAYVCLLATLFCSLAGAAMGMMMPCGRQSMKTQVGKSIHKLGVAVDHAVDNIVSEMR